jgi:hypothetical protein
MMLSLDRNGDGMDLELIGTVPNRTTLAGTVKRGRSGDGVTTLRSISGLAGVNRDRLRSPPFVVGAIGASVVDSLLETHSPAANSLSQLGDAAY